MARKRVTLRLGRSRIELEIVGAGLRNGQLPAPDEKRSWNVGPQDLATIQAFGEAGWRFQPGTDLDWNRAKELNQGQIEPGLLARRELGGLVILTNHIIARLPGPGAVDPDIGVAFPVPLQPGLFDVALHVPAGDLLGRIVDVLDERFPPAGERPRAEPLLLYRAVSPGAIYRVDIDPAIQPQWNTIELEAAWREAPKLGSGTRVAVIDRGFHLDQAELGIDFLDTAFVDASGNVGLPEFVDGQVRYMSKTVVIAPEMPVFPHGTKCAGLVGARQNVKKVNGAAPKCQLMLVAVETVTSTLAIANAIKICVNGIGQRPGADVISGSLGPERGVWDYAEHLRPEVEAAHRDGRGEKGVPIVWASFNFDEVIPADSLEANVICVSASTNEDYAIVRTSSGYGPALDLLAPGTDVTVFDPSVGGSVSVAMGASCAAPIVAGVAALILSENPDLTDEQVLEILRDNCDPDVSPKVHDDKIGFGRLNARRALRNTPRPQSLSSLPTPCKPPPPS